MSRPRTAAATARRAPAPRVPRRVSGPVRPRAVPGRPRPSTPVTQPTTGAIAARVLSLPDSRMLDRLLRSRAWIWLLGIALGGIVAMQVSLLGMNAGISKSVQTAEDLQHSNAALEEQIAELTGGDRMRNAASDLGLVLPDAGAVDFLKVRPGADARRAADRYTAPSDTARQNLAAGGVPATTVVTDPVPAVTDPTAATTTETAVEPVATPVTPVATTAPVTTTTTTTTETAPPTTAVAPPTTDTGAAEAP